VDPHDEKKSKKDQRKRGDASGGGTLAYLDPANGDKRGGREKKTTTGGESRPHARSFLVFLPSAARAGQKRKEKIKREKKERRRTPDGQRFKSSRKKEGKISNARAAAYDAVNARPWKGKSRGKEDKKKGGKLPECLLSLSRFGPREGGKGEKERKRGRCLPGPYPLLCLTSRREKKEKRRKEKEKKKKRNYIVLLLTFYDFYQQRKDKHRKEGGAGRLHSILQPAAKKGKRKSSKGRGRPVLHH